MKEVSIALARQCVNIRRQLSRLRPPLRLSVAGTALSIGVVSLGLRFPQIVSDDSHLRVTGCPSYRKQREPENDYVPCWSSKPSSMSPGFSNGNAESKSGGLFGIFAWPNNGACGVNARVQNSEGFDIVTAQLKISPNENQPSLKKIYYRFYSWPLWLGQGCISILSRYGAAASTTTALHLDHKLGEQSASVTPPEGTKSWSTENARLRYRLHWPNWFASAVVPGGVGTAVAKNWIDDFFNDPGHKQFLQSSFGPNDRLHYSTIGFGHRLPIPNPFSDDNRWRLRDLLIGTNILVFLLWQYLSRTPRGVSFFLRHFVGSPENLAVGRLHSTLLSGFSHMTFDHLLANCFGLYVLLSPQCLGGLLSDKEGLGVFCASNVVASLVQILYSRQIVLGSSGGVMALVVLEAALQPLEKFVLLFPIPGLTLTSVQVAQLAAVCNIAGVFFGTYGRRFLGRPVPGVAQVAWLGHLGGMLVGYLYCRWSYPRAFKTSSTSSSFERTTFYARPKPSSRWLSSGTWTQSADDWYFSTRDAIDSWRLKILRRQLWSINDPIQWAQLRLRIDSLEQIRQQRAIEHQHRQLERRRQRR